MATEKREKATPRKLRKAREKGQVPRSRDFAVAVGLLVALQVILLAMPGWRRQLAALFGVAFAALQSAPGGEGGATLDAALDLALPAAARLTMLMLLPLLATPVCVLGGSLLWGGWTVSTHSLMPRVQRLSPLANAKRLLSMRHIGTFLLGTLKTVTLAFALWLALRAGFAAMLHLLTLPLGAAVRTAGVQLFGVIAALLGIVMLFGIADAPMQRFLFMRQQRMSKQEVKQENKDSEGSPEVRRRIRQLQRQFAMRGLRRSVPQADVVIVNPEHYAVALKYDTARAEAPFVVAKGVDEMAMAIRRIAEAHHIEVLPLAPLARAVYYTSQIDQQIPAGLYRAVAIVLSYVMQLDAYRRGERRRRPVRPATVPVPAALVQPIES
ncbi:EscU/YscU/HrcU family type III secretion system export apparatus switch protein [Chitinasiproducens palmae]|uniref:Flagellar biosynthetic protein FlhB n=1 Tax=Chitinasiproducens palmae TaxID=1770053 RepID=A0A1H2PMG6_9BURK|nr:flagellar type III secretion system protein FlhB [Chitinasiproducens palmae]SDV46923.1 flagellar biosynthetic protein FlhB [Chitinasiproducens palmae]